MDRGRKRYQQHRGNRRSGTSRRYPWRRRSCSSSGRFSRPRFASPRARCLIVVAVVACFGLAIGLVLPYVSPPVARVTGEYVATGPVVEVLRTLVVDARQSGKGYKRDEFGYRQTDDDGNGCDIREDILARDLHDVRFTVAGGCVVRSGILEDPYTGRTIEFTRGTKSSTAVQIDHVVALENAWRSGASRWNRAQRYRFGNDPLNLLAVDGPANEEKGAASAAYWLPTNAEFRCTYVATQVAVKATYGLSVTPQEREAIAAVLRGCPSQQIPTRQTR
ncbi:HNH endonuclease family protein [Bifidobacterium apri]|uniref:HNH endonuclease family protein n=1 Tax=Bifidobacterium apri TaxID=1769423 RepID=UPI0039928D5C